MATNVRVYCFGFAIAASSVLLNTAIAQTAKPLLPVPAANKPLVSSGTASYQTSGQSATIVQSSDRAVLNWDSFNISKGNSVEFKQPGANSAALNLIHGAAPSEIQGVLKANGQIYLINKNGIMFKDGAQVNVGSLIASTLNITPKRFNGSILTLDPRTGGLLSPAFAKDGDAGAITVEQGAFIKADKNGRILLLAPNVTNAGTLQTNNGQVLIAAGEKVYLAGSDDTNLRGLLVEVDVGGTATNVGNIIAERGNATLAGLTVNQRGKISATTAVNANGSIRLIARDTAIGDPNVGGGTFKLAASVGGNVELAKGSITEVLPDFGDTSAIDGSALFQRSKVDIFGKTIKHEGTIKAPNGDVTLTARVNPTSLDPTATPDPVKTRNGSSIYLADGSVIDVSGGTSTLLPMSRNELEVELRGDELKDFPLQRNGVLRGSKVKIDVSLGTKVADVSKQIAALKRGIGELTSEGGTVSAISEGDIVMQRGATIDVSGGQVAYQSGFITTTKLYSKTTNKVYDISSAPADITYDQIIGVVQTRNRNGDIVKTINTLGTAEFREGFTQGKNAGEITFKAHGLQLDGTLKGQAKAGQFQRDVGQVPLGGALSVLDFNLGNADGERLHDVVFSYLGSQFESVFGAPVASDQPLTMPIDFITEGGFNRIKFVRNGKITLPEGIALALTPSSAVKSGSADTTPVRNSITLQGREIEIDGRIAAPAGDITLSTAIPATGIKNADGVVQSAGDVVVGPRAQLSTRGQWVNDRVAVLANDIPKGPAIINAGSVTLTSGRGIAVGDSGALTIDDTLIDVSSGGWVDAKGALKGGNGGNLTVKGIESFSFNSAILGFALNQGGTLTFDAPNINIVAGNVSRDVRGIPVVSGNANSESKVLSLPSEFFSALGFTRYSAKAYDESASASGVVVNPDTHISVAAPYLLPGTEYRLHASGSDIYTFSTFNNSLPEIRKPASLQLSAGRVGDVTIGTNASIVADPLASIDLVSNNNIFVDGTLSAAAGRISLSLRTVSLDPNFKPGQAIWLGHNARLESPGIVVNKPDPLLKKGEVLKGGQIALTADLGYVIAEPGSVIDVSGSSGEFDVLSSAGNGYERRRFGGDAGRISVTAAEGIYLSGALKANKGEEPGSFGGELIVSLDTSKRPGNLDAGGYPVNERQIIVRPGEAAGLPGEFTFGNAIPLEFNGKAIVYSGQIERGGFDSLTLNAAFDQYDTTISVGNVLAGKIIFDGGAALRAPQSIVLNAPLFAFGTGASVAANYVGIGSSDPVTQDFLPGYTASSGAGSVRIDAKMIDLVGSSITQGTSLVTLVSDGDIRLRGIVPTNGTNKEPNGRFLLAGDLDMQARQIYPSTLTHFEITTADGTVTTAQRGVAGPVLSAAGDLTLTAKNINHAGTILAPLGTITLQAAQSGGTLQLQPRSVLSVSAEGQIIPFGKTENGRDWVYELTIGAGVARFNAPRDKSIVLKGDNIELKSGSTIDLRGGGDLYAYEWVPGPGGSKDFLSNVIDGKATGYYAILPSLGSIYAPYDTQNYQGSNIQPGDSVYLAGSAGVPAGRYALLPARYALIPGAYLIKAETKFQDLLPGQSAQLRDGTPVVAGYFTHSDIDDSGRRMIGFSILAKDEIRARAEYRDTFANKFFVDRAIANDAVIPRVPNDAGRLALIASSSLGLQGALLTTAQDKGRGAAVDIAAGNILIQDAAVASADPGFINLLAADLVSLGAESLLIGGVRKSTDQGVEIQVLSTRIELGNSAAQPLSNGEIILAANDQITLRRGSVLLGKGSANTRSHKLIMSFARTDTNGDGSPDVAGGAVMRVSSGDGVTIARDFAIDRSVGTIVIEEGATVASDRSLAIDATHDIALKGTLGLGDKSQLSLSTGHITFGDGGDVTDGLVIPSAQLAQFEKLASLTLRSYSSIDIRGNTTFGSVDDQGKPSLANFVLDAASIRGFGDSTQAVTVHSGEFHLVNTIGSVVVGDATGSGLLTIDADRIVIGSGDKAISGFAKTSLNSRGEISASKSGKLVVQNDLTLSAFRVTAEKLSDQSIAGTGSLVITRPANTHAPVSAPDLGGKLSLSGRDIVQQGEILLPGGVLSLIATGSNGDVELDANSLTSVAGAQRTFDGKSVFVSGGKINLISQSGNVLINGAATAGGPAATVTVSGAEAGGNAGELSIGAARGHVAILGTISGTALQGYESARFDLDSAIINSDLARSVNSIASINDRLNDGGFNGARALRLREGDITIAPTDVVSAKEVQIVADSGAINVAGTIIAMSPRGGRIELWARDTLSLAATGKLIAGGGEADGRSAKILLASRNGSIDLLKDGQIAFNPGSVATGELTLRAPRTLAGNDVAINPIQSTLLGARDIIVEGVKVYSATTIGGSDPTSAGGNLNLAVNGAGDDLLFRETKMFGDAASSINARLFGANDARVQVRAGIEVRSDGDLTLLSSWNLRETYSIPILDSGGNPVLGPDGNPTINVVDAWRYVGAPINLTLVAKGNLNLGDPAIIPRSTARAIALLNDGFDGNAIGSTSTRPPIQPSALVSGHSASYRLVGGADLSSANSGAVALESTGDVVLAKNTVIRTGDGRIDIFASRDLTIPAVVRLDSASGAEYLEATSTIYTAGRPTKSEDYAELKDKFPTSGVTTGVRANYPTDGGDITVKVGGNVNGAKTQQLATEWLQRSGQTDQAGTIAIKSGEALNTSWWLDYAKFQQNIGALGGGDVRIAAGGNIDNLSVAIPTTGRLGGVPGVPIDAKNLVVLGGGNLQVDAGQDIRSGFYYVANGTAYIHADGNVIGARDASDTAPLTTGTIRTVLAASNAQFSLNALGNVELEAVINPTVFAQEKSIGNNPRRSSYFFTYGENSNIDGTSVGGDFKAFNNYETLLQSVRTPHAFDAAGALDVLRTYPSNVRFSATEGNVEVHNDFNIYPSSKGGLELLAEKDVRVDIGKIINLSDGDPGILVNPTHIPSGSAAESASALQVLTGLAVTHAAVPIYLTDSQSNSDPVRVVANLGSITGGQYYLAKNARFVAGMDIQDVQLSAQNLRVADSTMIKAGRDIIFTTPISPDTGLPLPNNAGFEISGPGNLFVQSGRDLDLGSSRGLVSIANRVNSALPLEGANITVVTGVPDASKYADFNRNYLNPETAGKSLPYLTGKGWADFAREVLGDKSLTNAVALDHYAQVQTQANASALIAYVKKIKGSTGDLSAEQAWTQFNGMSADVQRPLIEQIFFNELKLSGRAQAKVGKPAYDRGFAAIATLFPGENYKGDLSLLFSQIKTESGGDINLFVPGGKVNAGQTSQGGNSSLSKGDDQLGIVAQDFGGVHAFTRGNFEVNESRVFTLRGGDILIWSSNGDIDAGRGAKTALSAPAPVLITLPNGQTIFKVLAVRGSGIRGILTDPDVKPGDVDLIAPEGVVNAGDAGIGSAGNITIAAVEVRGAGNIDIGGKASGVPTVDTGGLGAAVGNVGSSSQDATKATDEMAKKIADTTQLSESLKQTFKPTFITVEVIGYGEDDDDEKKKKK